VSQPRAPLIDENTGEPVEFYSLNDVAFDIGVFDKNGFPLNLGNLAFLSCDLLNDPDACDIQATSTLAADDINALITSQNWEADLDQNATISFGQAQLGNLSFLDDAGLEYKPSKWFWMVIHGITAAGEDIAYGAGWVRIFNVGVKTLNLPLYPPPTVIPFGTTYTIPAGVVITVTQPIQIFGALVLAPAVGQTPAGQLITL
jgi:hypothetical protein